MSEIENILSKTQDELMRCFFVCGRMSTKDLLTKTVKGDTVRGLTKKKFSYKHKPTMVFRHWLWSEYLHDEEGFISMLNTSQNFENLHGSLLEALVKFWSTKDEDMVIKMPFYFFTKMIDLLFKSISRWEEMTSERQMWFFENAHLPLDKYSFDGLRRYELIAPFAIPKNVSMGWVDSKVVEDIRDRGQYMRFYSDIQKYVRERLNPYPPMLFDLHVFRSSEEKISQKDWELIP